MKKRLAIIGAGDLGKQVAHLSICDNHYKKVMFFDDFYKNKVFCGYDVLGNMNEIKHFYDKGFFDEIIIAIGYKHINFREELFNIITKLKIPIGNIIHSSCVIDSTVKFGVGNILYPGVVIDSNVELKDNILINVGCSISHDTTINSHCFLSPRVALAGFVSVGKKCILGINSTVIDNISITDSIQLGGGCVIIKNLEKSGLYVGNPARFIR